MRGDFGFEEIACGTSLISRVSPSFAVTSQPRRNAAQTSSPQFLKPLDLRLFQDFSYLPNTYPLAKCGGVEVTCKTLQGAGESPQPPPREKKLGGKKSDDPRPELQTAIRDTTRPTHHAPKLLQPPYLLANLHPTSLTLLRAGV